MQKILTFFVLFICLHAEFAIRFTQASPIHWQNKSFELIGGDMLVEVSKARTATPYEWKLWPDKTVHYRIARDFDESDRAEIVRAMEHIEFHTCIRFIEVPRYSSFPYLRIETNIRGAGCSAIVGYDEWHHFVNLNRTEGCVSFPVIVHELLHSLGLYHQQDAKNRDDFIEIIRENLKPNYKNVFDISRYIKSMDLGPAVGIPYDYYSIMHYVTTAYSINDSLVTLRVKDPRIDTNLIGHGKYMSQGDILKLNMLYEC